jgi:hypothetical protein
LVGGSNDTHIDMYRCEACDAVKLAFCENAKQPSLQLHWHVTDLIEEERAAARLLEASKALHVCTGKCALFQTEQL